MAAPANTVDDTGRPIFVEQDLPVTGSAQHHAGPDLLRRAVAELLDRRHQASRDRRSERHEPDDGSDQQTNHYTGTGGVSIGSTFRQLLFALKFGDKNILLSERHHEGLADPLRPQSAHPGAEGGAVADARR